MLNGEDVDPEAAAAWIEELGIVEAEVGTEGVGLN